MYQGSTSTISCAIVSRTSSWRVVSPGKWVYVIFFPALNIRDSLNRTQQDRLAAGLHPQQIFCRVVYGRWRMSHLGN